jgi:excisionase family DNA binding protein
MKRYSTRQAARKLGVGQPSLYRWIREGHVRPPRKQKWGGLFVRWWTERDLARVRRYMEQHYREFKKGTGRREKFDLRELVE